MRSISIAEDFSAYPGGRVPADGPYSGQEFRDNILVPVLKDDNTEKVCIDFDGTRGYGSSFLEEAFGGLIRMSKFSKAQIYKKFEFKSSRESIIEEVTKYIDDAEHANHD